MVLNPCQFPYIAIADNDLSYKNILNNNEIAGSDEELVATLVPHSRSKILAIKLSSKILIQLLPMLMWMFTSRCLNIALNSFHERTLILICND